MPAFKTNGWGTCFNNQILSDFCNGWIDYRDAFHAVLCLYVSLCNGLKISEYEVYWLTDFLLINSWARANKEWWCSSTNYKISWCCATSKNQAPCSSTRTNHPCIKNIQCIVMYLFFELNKFLIMHFVICESLGIPKIHC